MPHYARVPESIYTDPRISPAQLRVLIHLIGYADRDTGVCFPSLRELAHGKKGRRGLGRTRSTIRHHLRGLVELGVITRDPMRRKDGSCGANLYTIPAVRQLTIELLQAAVRPAATATPEEKSRPIPATGKRTSSGAGAPADAETIASHQIEILLPLQGGRPQRERRAPRRQRSSILDAGSGRIGRWAS